MLIHSRYGNAALFKVKRHLYSSIIKNRFFQVYYFCPVFSKLQLLWKYIRYYSKAYNGKGHGMHSPFVYDFIISVLNDKTHYADYDRVETLRRQLLADNTILEVNDLGAGSVKNNRSGRSIADIARHAAKPAKFGQLLFRMAKYYQPQHILELGTSLGITTQYLAMARPGGSLITVEGAATVAAVAEEKIRAAGIGNVQLLQGNFDERLPEVLKTRPRPDLVFIDGNHREEPTVRYFEQLAAVAHNDTILIFDDIHWSREMEQAWAHIKAHHAVRCTIDLFFIGIVLFRQEFREKQDFAIRF